MAGKYPTAVGVLTVTLDKNRRGQACGLQTSERARKRDWSRLAHGAYLLHTNHPGGDPAQLWRWYIPLTQAEAAFRTGKSDLHLRPCFTRRPSGWRRTSW